MSKARKATASSFFSGAQVRIFCQYDGYRKEYCRDSVLFVPRAVERTSGNSIGLNRESYHETFCTRMREEVFAAFGQGQRLPPGVVPGRVKRLPGWRGTAFIDQKLNLKDDVEEKTYYQ